MLCLTWKMGRWVWEERGLLRGAVGRGGGDGVGGLIELLK